jgi:(p)ppGpp synthase/HD superfamily hydrolase
MIRNYENDKLIEKAIIFLVTSIEKSGKNPKPVILHSIRVSMHLESLGCSREVIIGAILHDLLEDTDVTSDEIKQDFGELIAGLVEANSFQKDIANETERYKRMYDQCRKSGKDALVIKAADILDNSYYYGPRKDLIEKMRYFIDVSKKELNRERIWKELLDQYERIKPA